MVYLNQLSQASRTMLHPYRRIWTSKQRTEVQLPKVLKGVKVTEEDIPKEIGSPDAKGIFANLVHPDCVKIDNLSNLIKFTVTLQDSTGDRCGNGVIVDNGKHKYVTTDYHCVNHELKKRRSGLHAVLFLGNKRFEIPLSRSSLVRIVTDEGDAGIFKYKGKAEGARCCDYLKAEEIYPACVVGYSYNSNETPLFAFGYTSYESVAPDLFAGLEVPEELEHLQCKALQGALIFTGATVYGYSGSGLFNLKGELMGIHAGRGYIHDRENDRHITIKYSSYIHTLLKDLE